MTGVSGGRDALAEYATGALRGEAVYRGYKPRLAVLQQVAEALPRAHVLVFAGAWCGDCRREVPKFARIMEGLPGGWTVELMGDADDVRQRMRVRAIPTFLVLSEDGGQELGRIIESPHGPDGIEGDLLKIADGAKHTV